MQPKPFIYRMGKMKEACESEGQSQAIVASHVAVSPPSNIASRMRVSTVCEGDTRIVRTSKITSKKCLRTSSQVNQRRATRQVAVSLEQSESSSMKDVRTMPTKSRSMSPRDEDGDEPPRSLKRKRQSPRILTTPTNSAPSTPNHSQVSESTTPDSTDVSRKNRSMRREKPAIDEQPATPSRPRLRSEAKRLIAEAEQGKNDSRSLQDKLTALRADLEKEKLANSKLMAQATKDRRILENLRAEFNTLRSEYASERWSNAEAEEELAALRADVELPPCEFEGELSGDGNVSPETHSKLDKVIHMNEILRRVLRGERIYNKEMHGKLHSLRKKVGPLLAKVDTLQGAVDEMEAHFRAHDAPIELIMDFVRNFHQWWVDRYNARQESGGSGQNNRVQH